MIVVLNKMDLPDVVEKWPRIQKELEKRGYEALPVSAVAHTNLKKMLWRVHQLLEEAPLPEIEEALPVYRPEEDPEAFTIEKSPEGWRISGSAIERAAAMTYWEHYGSVRRFHGLLQVLGIEDALVEAGIEEGDTVFIGEHILEWQD